MGHFGCAVEVDVHLAAQRGHFHVDKQFWGGHSGDAPDDVGRIAIVPFPDLSEERSSVRWGRDIGSDVVKSLIILVCGGSLERLCQWSDIYGIAENTYLDDFEGVLELIDAARDKDNVGTFERQQLRG